MNRNKLISDYILSQRDNMISDLRTLVRVKSSRGDAEEGFPFGKGPAQAFETLLGMCGGIGLHTENIGNYIGTAELFKDREQYLGILCHVDTVPDGGGWNYPAYDVTEKDGVLYGRGVIDDKGPAIAVLYAIKAVKELGFKLERNVRFIFGTDEECGSGDLDLYRKEHKMPPLLMTPDGAYPLINCEKGLIRAELTRTVTSADSRLKRFSGGKTINAVPDFAEAEICGISADKVENTARALALDVTFDLEEKDGGLIITAHGKNAHASLPHDGINAVTALFTLLSKLDCGSLAQDMHRLFPHGESDGRSCNISCSDEKSGALTAVLSVAEYDGAAFRAYADIRVPADFRSDRTMEKLAEYVGPLGLDARAVIMLEPHYVPESSPFVKTLLEVYSDITGKNGSAHSLGGLTYVHGIPNSVAFGAEELDDNHNMHGADEFIETELLMLNAEIYANAILRLCSATKGSTV